MAKNIMKEIIIFLLLILAIILILGVLLYEYVPNNKIIPEQVAYTTPENVKSELATDTNVDETEIVVTYEINETDLKNYKKGQSYVSGKKNPFESIETNTTNTTGSSTETSTSSSNGSTTQTNQSTQTTNSDTAQSTNTTNTTGYLPDKGTK